MTIEIDNGTVWQRAPELPPAAGLRSPARPKLCAAAAEAAAVFDEALV